ncbi:MAG: SCO family protein [Leptospirales bacterium]
MVKKEKTSLWFIFPILFLILWFIGIHRWTGGFTSFTTYSYTLWAAGDLPRELPPFKLTDHNGNHVDFSKWKGKYVLLDFMYLQCSSICGILRSRLIDYYDRLSAFIPDKLIFVSVSFDPERDNVDILHEAWRSSGESPGWVFAVFTPDAERGTQLWKTHLKDFGVIAIRNNLGDFNHTAYHYLLRTDGKLSAVIDPAEGMEKNLEEIRENLER